ncbi:hypothetical protein Bresa_03515|uniref:Uncharacterized protein n=1 Tax=Brenneria salicis ATCC 15712 = DSM 30166 TaxID=714314 RepID=A0A366I7V8_9GAMM|nr:hypothetical protein [Brenneria salicis ATCC 15712 = DSM 30166]RBP65201.1 hypothetical protein DES54_10579 [Brenneria salicis ATCC 15712 = DSM 30166]
MLNVEDFPIYVTVFVFWSSFNENDLLDKKN